MLLEKDATPLNERITTRRLPLRRNSYITFISVYTPTMTNSNEAKEQFCSDLRATIARVPHGDRLVLIGNFNAKVGAHSEKWEGVLGS